MGSFQVDEALVQQRASAEAAPHIAHMIQVDAAQRAAVEVNTARIVGKIQRIGADATARMNAVEAANDAQHADWNATQVDHARNTQGVSNYLLDQSVVEVNDGNGTVGHGTFWNKTAEALVKSDPNHFSYVDVPNYWAGTDFRP
jgi:endo-beta-N-acetylglucosaminidase D